LVIGLPVGGELDGVSVQKFPDAAAYSASVLIVYEANSLSGWRKTKFLPEEELSINSSVILAARFEDD